MPHPLFQALLGSFAIWPFTLQVIDCLSFVAEKLLNKFRGNFETKTFKELTAEDTRKWNKKPKNLSK